MFNLKLVATSALSALGRPRDPTKFGHGPWPMFAYDPLSHSATTNGDQSRRRCARTPLPVGADCAGRLPVLFESLHRYTRMNHAGFAVSETKKRESCSGRKIGTFLRAFMRVAAVADKTGIPRAHARMLEGRRGDRRREGGWRTQVVDLHGCPMFAAPRRHGSKARLARISVTGNAPPGDVSGGAVSFWDVARFLARELASGHERGLDRKPAKLEAGNAFSVRCAAASGDKDTLRLVSAMVPFVERWFDSALPHVTVGETHAASLCAMAVPAGRGSTERLPFDCIGLSIPPGIFGSPVDMFIMDARTAGRVDCLVQLPEGFAIGESVDFRRLAEIGEPATTELANKDVRAFGRLVAGVMLELSLVPRGTFSPSARRTKRRPGRLPRMWPLWLSGPVGPDDHPEIRKHPASQLR